MYEILFYGHIILMSIAGISSVTAIIYARYLKKKTKAWMKIHKILGITALFSFLLGFLSAFFMLGGFSGYHFTNNHAYWGLTSIIIVLCTTLMGLRMTGKKTSSAIKKKIRIIHPWFGRIAVVSILITNFLGLLIAGIIYF